MNLCSCLGPVLQVKFLFGYNTRPNPANTDFLTLPAINFPR